MIEYVKSSLYKVELQQAAVELNNLKQKMEKVIVRTPGSTL